MKYLSFNRIVETHGRCIWLQSVSKGSKFCFTLTVCAHHSDAYREHLSPFLQRMNWTVLPLLLLCLLSLSACQQEVQSSNFEQQDLTKHTVYSKYDFGDESVIDIGVQPMWVPTNIIVEAMKHDEILQENLKAQGMSVRFHAFTMGSDINFFLQRGDLDAAVGGDMPTLVAAASGDVLVASMIQQGFVSIVAKKQMLLTEIKGKRIAYAPGSNAHYALLNAMSSTGIELSELQLIPLDVSQMGAALNREEIDLFAAWEPTPSIAVSEQQAKVVYRSLSTGYLYFSHNYAKRHPKRVRQIIASQIRSMGWLNVNKKNLYTAIEWSIETWHRFTTIEMPLSVIQMTTLAKGDILQLTSMPDIPKKKLDDHGRLHNEFEFLKRMGAVDETLLWRDVRPSFSNHIIGEVMKTPT